MDQISIERFEQKGDSLYICIKHVSKPVKTEHFFSEEEKKTNEAIELTIERLINSLFLTADAYIEPLTVNDFKKNIDRTFCCKNEKVRLIKN
jgi:hypothetical protein